jgi:hypothetical protein
MTEASADAEGPDANDVADDREDEEVVTQQTFRRDRHEPPEYPYRNAPRTWRREADVSVFRGRVSAQDATKYIVAARNRPSELTAEEKARIRVRRLSATKLREAGFGIISPGERVSYPEHCGVVWPADGPPNPNWPQGVQDAFNACSTGEEEGWQE